jgi:ribosome-associated protein
VQKNVVSARGGFTILAKTPPALSAEALKTIIEASLDDDKAENIVAIDLAGKSSFADYMVVATGRSQRHVATLADKLSTRLKEINMPPLSIEGKVAGDWVLVDCGDIIVHIFRQEIRELYNLEKMWAMPLQRPESVGQNVTH